MLAAGLVLALQLSSSPGAFDPQPWREDLSQARTAFELKYANWEWATFERQAEMSKLFQDADRKISQSTSEADAKAAFGRLVERLGDGHVEVDWPASARVGPTSAKSIQASPVVIPICAQLGYDSKRAGEPIAALAPYYASLPVNSSPEFPAGLIKSGAKTFGVVRIGEFSPQDSPELCADSLKELAFKSDAACDDDCADRVETEAYMLMSQHLARRLRELRAAGATNLIVDVTDNGGGSEWAEVAARIISSRPILSETLGFVRDAHWVEKWADLSTALRKAAKTATMPDRKRLIDWAAEAEAAEMQARTPCASAPFLKQELPRCSWLGHEGYATGLVREMAPDAFIGKSWGPLVFSPAGFTYERGVWQGPIVVLVNGQTWSAAEEFAAVLQDSGVATVAGSPSGGAGCGHTGDEPTVLAHSKGTLHLPDCARFRANGRNEVGGIDPDVLIGWRPNDGAQRKALRLAASLPRL